MQRVIFADVHNDPGAIKWMDVEGDKIVATSQIEMTEAILRGASVRNLGVGKHPDFRLIPSPQLGWVTFPGVVEEIMDI